MQPGRRAADSAADVERLARTARRLLQSGGLVESVGGSERLEREELTRALAREVRGEEVLAAGIAGTAPAGALAQAAAERAVQSAETALVKLAGGRPAGNLSDEEVSALEAIVLVTGRPAMGFVAGRVQMPPDLGDNAPWRVLVAIAGSSINLAATSVGRIDLTPAGELPTVVGTGWRLGKDLVITNRHVARQLALDPTLSVDRWTIDRAKPSTIDFAQKTNGSFAIASLAYVAPDDSIDLAVCRLQTDQRAAPASLPIQWDELAIGRLVPQGNDMVFQGKKLYVLGHPWRPFSSTAIAAVFGTPDGSKRWSPGYATALDGTVPRLEHDCSTLGGHSGSCVLSADGHEVVALHFGGRDVAELSGRGAANTALPLYALATHPAGQILRAGQV